MGTCLITGGSICGASPFCRSVQEPERITDQFCHDLHDPSVDSDGVLPEQYGDRKRCAACHAEFYDGTGAGVFSCNDDDLYVASAGVYYEFILLLVSGLQRVLELFVLPCIEIYVLLVMVDHLSGEERLSRLTELLEMVVGWSLKGVVAAVMAFHMIQGLLTPAADAFRKLTVSKGIEMIPGIGDAGSSVTDMVLGSAMLIKNGIGAAALVVLLLLCLIPLAKLGIMMAAYYLLAAVLQPISDERITGCLAGVGCGMKLLFQTICMVLVLFLLTVALTTAITGR